MNGRASQGGSRGDHHPAGDRAAHARVHDVVPQRRAAGPAQAGDAGHPRDVSASSSSRERRCALLREHGVHVDEATQVAKFPPDLVLAAMATAPRTFTLGARDASCDIAVGDGSTYCTTDGCGVEIVDFATRRAPRRRPRPTSRTSRACRTTSAASPSGGRRSAPATAARRRSCTSSTPAGTTPSSTCRAWCNGEREARYAVEMATVDRRRAPRSSAAGPSMSDLIGTISPLVVDKDGIEAALVFAEAGMPVVLRDHADPRHDGAGHQGRRLRARLPPSSSPRPCCCSSRSPGAPVLGSIMQSCADPRTGDFVSFPLDERGALPGHRARRITGACRPSRPPAAPTRPRRAPGRPASRRRWTSRSRLRRAASCCPRIGLVNVYTLFYPEHLILGDDIYHRARYALMDIDLRRRGARARRDRRGGARRALPRPQAHPRAHARGDGPGGHASAQARGRRLPRSRRGRAREGGVALARVPAGAARGRRSGRAADVLAAADAELRGEPADTGAARVARRPDTRAKGVRPGRRCRMAGDGRRCDGTGDRGAPRGAHGRARRQGQRGEPRRHGALRHQRRRRLRRVGVRAAAHGEAAAPRPRAWRSRSGTRATTRRASWPA